MEKKQSSCNGTKFIIAANAEFFDELEIDEIIFSNFINVLTIFSIHFSG